MSRRNRNDSPVNQENRRVLGPSIETRPEDVEFRGHFGHWEIDTLIGARTKDDPVLLTVERKTRFEFMFKIDRQDQPSVDLAMNELYEQLGDYKKDIFKIITSVNGSEFDGIYTLLAKA